MQGCMQSLPSIWQTICSSSHPAAPGVWAGEDGKVVGANLFLLYLQQIRKTQGVSFSAVRSMSHLRNGKLRHVISAPYNCLAKP